MQGRSVPHDKRMAHNAAYLANNPWVTLRFTKILTLQYFRSSGTLIQIITVYFQGDVYFPYVVRSFLYLFSGGWLFLWCILDSAWLKDWINLSTVKKETNFQTIHENCPHKSTATPNRSIICYPLRSREGKKKGKPFCHAPGQLSTNQLALQFPISRGDSFRTFRAQHGNILPNDVSKETGGAAGSESAATRTQNRVLQSNISSRGILSRVQHGVTSDAAEWCNSSIRLHKQRHHRNAQLCYQPRKIIFHVSVKLFNISSSRAILGKTNYEPLASLNADPAYITIVNRKMLV